MLAQRSGDEHTRALTDPKVVAEVKSGLFDINVSLNSIGDEFSAIGSDLNGVKDSKPLVDEWKTLQDRNYKVNSLFRRTAGSLRDFLDPFETAVLAEAAPVVEDPKDDKARQRAAREADFFLDDAENLKEEIGGLTDQFAAFQTRLTKFDDTYDGFADLKQTENGRKIKEKTDHVSELEKDRDGIAAKIKDVVVDYLKEKSGRYRWIWDLPFARVLSIVLEVVIDKAVQEKIKGLQKQYDVLTQQIVDEKVALEQVKASSENLDVIRAKLFLQKTIHLEQVAGGVDLFKQLFELVNSDCSSLHVYVKDPSTGKVPDVLKEYKSNNQASVYAGIIDALRAFIIA